jgi:hypothetical protein
VLLRLFDKYFLSATSVNFPPSGRGWESFFKKLLFYKVLAKFFYGKVFTR